MKQKWLLLSVVLTASFGMIPSGYGENGFSAAEDPVAWENPNAGVPGRVYVSRFGYWLDQPVKMAYWTALPHQKIPPVFQIADMLGKIVYTGHPQWMPDPTRVMVPIGFFYPGLKIYALNFSGFHEEGVYYIEVPGYQNSGEFQIRGYLPGMLRNMPGQIAFEEDAGMMPVRRVLRRRLIRPVD